jgi:membrane protease YdiL (CAAX protease family)
VTRVGLAVHRTFHSMKHSRNFRLFFVGQAISVIGTWMQMVARGWLVLELTNSPLMLGINSALQVVPFLLVALVPAVYVALAHGQAVRKLLGAWSRPLLMLAVGVVVGASAYVAIRIVLGVLLFIGTGGDIPDLPEVQPELRELARDPDIAVWFMLTALLLAPVAEEVLYRGMLYQGLRKRIGVWPAIGFSSLVFTVLHLGGETLDANLLLFVTVFPLSMLLAWVFERRGTLLLPIGLHAGHNLIGLILFRLGFG